MVPLESFTPPRLAKRWLVKPDKVLRFIRSGELRAINVASFGSLRPRYVITAEAVAEFERRRSSQPPPASPRKRRPESPKLIEFF